MKFLKPYTSLLILLCMFALLCPKNLFHNCEPQNQTQDYKGKVKIQADDCYGCHIDLNTFDSPQFLQFIFAAAPFNDLSDLKIVRRISDHRTQTALRGPPKIIYS